MRKPCSMSTGRVCCPFILVLVWPWMRISVLAAGKALPVFWSRNGQITCSDTPAVSSMIVVEEGFFTAPSSTCDDQCRPQMEAGPDVTCYFRNDSCVQGLSSRDLAAIYDLCWPMSLPCNLSKAGLAASVVVRFSCLTGRIFDPFNATFNWKDSGVLMSFHSASLNANADVITTCSVQPDPLNSSLSLHFTGLNFPQVVQAANSSVVRKSNDIIVHEGSESWNLSESLYPVWRRVSNGPVRVEFHMTPSHQKRPVWLSFRELNQDKRFEVICKSGPPPPTAVMTPVKPTQEIVRKDTQNLFTFKELLLACACTAVLVLLLLTAFCCIRYYTRKRRKRSEDRYTRNLVARFDNRPPDGALAISSGTEHPTCCFDETETTGCSSCLSTSDPRYSDFALVRCGTPLSSPCQATSVLPSPLFKEALPPGSSLSNASYENMEEKSSLSKTNSHDSAGYLCPVDVTSVKEFRQTHSRGVGMEPSPLHVTRPLPREPSATGAQSDSARGQNSLTNFQNPSEVASLQFEGVLLENVEYEEIPVLLSSDSKKC